MNNEAIKYLYEMTERSKKTKQSKYLLLQNFIIFDNLRADPGFQEILTKHKEWYEDNLKKYSDLEL